MNEASHRATDGLTAWRGQIRQRGEFRQQGIRKVRQGQVAEIWWGGADNASVPPASGVFPQGASPSPLLPCVNRVWTDGFLLFGLVLIVVHYRNDGVFLFDHRMGRFIVLRGDHHHHFVVLVIAFFVLFLDVVVEHVEPLAPSPTRAQRPPNLSRRGSASACPVAGEGASKSSIRVALFSPESLGLASARIRRSSAPVVDTKPTTTSAVLPPAPSNWPA